jgi:hypothetical protein
MATRWQIFGKEHAIREGRSWCRPLLGLPRKYRSRTMRQQYGAAFAEIDRAIELDKNGLIERRGNDARETAVVVA